MLAAGYRARRGGVLAALQGDEDCKVGGGLTAGKKNVAGVSLE